MHIFILNIYTYTLYPGLLVGPYLQDIPDIPISDPIMGSAGGCGQATVECTVCFEDAKLEVGHKQSWRSRKQGMERVLYILTLNIIIYIYDIFLIWPMAKL